MGAIYLIWDIFQPRGWSVATSRSHVILTIIVLIAIQKITAFVPNSLRKSFIFRHASLPNILTSLISTLSLVRYLVYILYSLQFNHVSF